MVILELSKKFPYVECKCLKANVKCNKDKNLCASLTRKDKKSFYENVDINDINGNRKLRLSYD